MTTLQRKVEIPFDLEYKYLLADEKMYHFFFKDKEAYIYIETSSPRMYSEKARLSSPWKTGPQRMEFFYSMNGSTIETLSVYVKINGSEYRVWSRYGSQLSSDWIKGCVTLNYRGNYQVKTFFPSLLFFVGLFVFVFFVCGCFFFVFFFLGGGVGGGSLR